MSQRGIPPKKKQDTDFGMPSTEKCITAIDDVGSYGNLPHKFLCEYAMRKD
jgi:hypothetical protein